ncbi:cytochrome P450 [Embleya sp. NPDC001921]
MTTFETTTAWTEPPSGHAEMLDWLAERRAKDGPWQDEKGNWHVFRYRDVLDVLNDHTTFSSDLRDLSPRHAEFDVFKKGLFISMDEPQHRKLRGLVSQAFTPKVVGKLAPRVAEIAHEMLDAVQDRDRIELVGDLAYPLPVIVIAELIGVPTSDRATFQRWADALLGIGGEVTAAPDGEVLSSLTLTLREMNAYLLDHIRSRRANPNGDLTSNLIAAEIDGEHLEDEEIVGFVGMLLLAGHIMTTLMISATLSCLDDHRDAITEIRREPDALPGAIEEVLRFRTPSVRQERLALREATVGGGLVPAGASLVLWLSGANRDAGQFPDADRFDIRRTPNAHLSFGRGIHHCIGAPLARLECKTVLEVLFGRFTEFAGAGAVPHDARSSFAPLKLPLDVTWA